jgi:hypothetical protein
LYLNKSTPKVAYLMMMMMMMTMMMMMMTMTGGRPQEHGFLRLPGGARPRYRCCDRCGHGHRAGQDRQDHRVGAVVIVIIVIMMMIDIIIIIIIIIIIGHVLSLDDA